MKKDLFIPKYSFLKSKVYTIINRLFSTVKPRINFLVKSCVFFFSLSAFLWGVENKEYAEIEKNLNSMSDMEAVSYLAKLQEKNPKNAHVLFRLGWYLQKREDDDTAEKYYKRSLSYAPNYSPALINMGNIHKRRKEFEKAEEYYKKAVNASPESGSGYYNLGTLYVDLERKEDAKEALSKCVKLSPENISARLNLASIYMDLFKINHKKSYLSFAKRNLLEASRIDKRYAHVYYNLGIIYEMENKPDTAIEFYKEAVRYYKAHHPMKKKAMKRIDYLSFLIK